MQIILLLVVAFIIVFLYINAFYFFYAAVPPLSSNKKVLEKLFKHIDFSGKNNFYDLGSGNGKLISLVACKYPHMECIGIECNLAVYFWAVLRNTFSGRKVDFRREDFFKSNLGNADIIFVYLFPGIMRKLEIKLEKELKSGALVVSNSFAMKTKRPQLVIRGGKNALDTLYIYKY